MPEAQDSQAYLSFLVQSLEDWGRQPNSMFLQSWMAQEGLSEAKLRSHSQSHPPLQEALDRAIIRIQAHLMENAAFQKDSLYDSKTLIWSLERQHGFHEKKQVNINQNERVDKYRVPHTRPLHLSAPEAEPATDPGPSPAE